jgi:HEAT repeat protein
VIRARAADALGMLGDPAAVPALLDALKDEVDAVRGHAASALGRIGDRRATDALIAMLGDSDVWLRWAAAEGLGYLGDPAAAIPILQAWLNAEHEALLNVITEAFKRMGQAAIPALQEAQRGEDVNMQRAAAYMIVQIEESTPFTDNMN